MDTAAEPKVGIDSLKAQSKKTSWIARRRTLICLASPFKNITQVARNPARRFVGLDDVAIASIFAELEIQMLLGQGCILSSCPPTTPPSPTPSSTPSLPTCWPCRIKSQMKQQNSKWGIQKVPTMDRIDNLVYCGRRTTEGSLSNFAIFSTVALCFGSVARFTNSSGSF